MTDDQDFAAQLDALDGDPSAAQGTSQTAEELTNSPVYQQLREYHAATRQKQVDDAIQGSAAQAQQSDWTRYLPPRLRLAAAAPGVAIDAAKNAEPTPEHLSAQAQQRFEEAGREVAGAQSQIAAAQAQLEAFNREHPPVENETVYPHEHAKTYEGTNYGLKRAELQTAADMAKRQYEAAMVAHEEAKAAVANPAIAQQGIGESALQAVMEDIRNYSQSQQAVRGQNVTEYPRSPSSAPIDFSWPPRSSVMPKLAYTVGGMGSVLAAGVAGGGAGAAAGTAIAPGVGTAAGALLGGAAGAGIAATAKELGPHFLHRLQQIPETDPERAQKAFDAAVGDAAISGAFSSAGWALFPLKLPGKALQGPVKNLLFQAFGVQPTVSMTQQSVMNVRYGEPATKDLGQAYAEGAVGTALPMAGHMAVSHLISAPGRLAAGEMPPPMAEKPGGEPPSGAPATTATAATFSGTEGEQPANVAPEQPQSGPIATVAQHIERLIPRNEDGTVDLTRIQEAIENLPLPEREQAQSIAHELISDPDRAIRTAQEALRQPEAQAPANAAPAGEAQPRAPEAAPATPAAPEVQEHFRSMGEILADAAGRPDIIPYLEEYRVEDPNTRALIETLHEQGRSAEEIKSEVQRIADVYNQEAQSQEGVGSRGDGQREARAAGYSNAEGRAQEQTIGGGGQVGGAERAGSAEASQAAPVRGQPGREGASGGAGAGGVTPELGAKFRAILGGSSKRSEWHREVGVTPDHLQRDLIPWAIKEGLLRQTKNGVLRTAKTKEATPKEQAGRTASWVVRNKETGESLFETFDKKKVDALNTAKYEAVPIKDYLEWHNRRVKEAGGVEPSKAVPEVITDPITGKRVTINPNGETPESFWSYKSGPVPTVEDAIRAGAIKADTTQKQWEQMSPGFRREILRSTLKMQEREQPTLTPETHTRIERAIDEFTAATGRKPSREVKNYAAALEAARESKTGFRELIEEIKADPEVSARDAADIAALTGEDVAGLGKEDALGKVSLAKGYLSAENIREALGRGEVAEVPRETVDEAHAILRAYERETPPHVMAAALTHIEPIGGPNGDRARLNFSTPDGRGFARIIPRKDIGGFRAAYYPSNRVIGLVHTGLGGQRAAEPLVNSLAGQVRHEVSHALRHIGLFTEGEWGALLGHAENLKILDVELRHFLKVVGDPNYRFAREGLTIGEAYAKEYKGDPELIAQEAVAHAVELYHHMQALPSDHVISREVMPRFREVEPILQKMFSGEIAARDPAEVKAFNDGTLAAITAYHGGPHDFDRFDSSKIGTGEGAQAYGHGLYFAQSEGVARVYQEQLAHMTKDGQHMSTGDADWHIANAAKEASPEITQQSADLISTNFVDALKYGHDLGKLRDDLIAQRTEDKGFAAGVDAAYRSAKGFERNHGRLYTVSLDVEPHELLDWDKPLSEQPEGVREAVLKVANESGAKEPALEASSGIVNKFYDELKTVLPKPFNSYHYANLVLYYPDKFDARGAIKELSPNRIKPFEDIMERWDKLLSPESAPASAWYDAITQSLQRKWEAGFSELEGYPKGWGHVFNGKEMQTGASDALHKAGIPGIRYLDQGSRTAGEGSHNYVIFPGAEDRIKITAKDGKPVSTEERKDVLDQSQEEQKPQYALSGDKYQFSEEEKPYGIVWGSEAGLAAADIVRQRARLAGLEAAATGGDVKAADQARVRVAMIADKADALVREWSMSNSPENKAAAGELHAAANDLKAAFEALQAKVQRARMEGKASHITRLSDGTRQFKISKLSTKEAKSLIEEIKQYGDSGVSQSRLVRMVDGSIRIHPQKLTAGTAKKFIGELRNHIADLKQNGNTAGVDFEAFRAAAAGTDAAIGRFEDYTRQAYDAIEYGRQSAEAESAAARGPQVQVSSELRPLADAVAQVRAVLGIPETQGRHGLEIGEGSRIQGGKGQSDRDVISSLDDMARAGSERVGDILGDELREATHLHSQELSRAGGFGEWFRSFIRNPEGAKADAPQFYDALVEMLDARDSALIERFTNLQDAVRDPNVQERLAQASIDPKFQETFGVPREHLFSELSSAAAPYAKAASTYKALNPDAAAVYLSKMPESVRSYVLFAGDRSIASLHPLIRAKAANEILHKLGADVIRNQLRDTSSMDAGRIFVSPGQQQRLVDIFTRLSGAELSNAAELIGASKEAAGRGEISTTPIMNELRDESMPVFDELQRRMAKAKIVPWDTVKSMYPHQAEIAEKDFNDKVDAIYSTITEQKYNLKPGSVGAGDGGGSGPPPNPPSSGGFDRIPDGPFGQRLHNIVERMGLGDFVRDLQMKITPMAVRDATMESRAAAKDFANYTREAQWESAHIDKELQREFKPEELKAMWEAADEESVLRQQGRSTVGRGLARLTEKQRAKVSELQARANEAYEAATAAGVVEPGSVGLPSYVPRMVVMAGESGYAPPTKQKGGLPLDAMGRNLTTTTPNVKHRMHITAAETEAAAKAKFGDEAMVVRDIRTLNIATSRLKQAVAGKTIINRIKEIGRLSGDATVFEGAAPSDSPYKWFTLDHPAFKTWRPRLEKSADGKWSVVKDEQGNPVFDQVPIYVRSDFEGPLKAVLSQKSGAVYNALMAIKTNSVGLIMYSPAIHNAVEFARAMPVIPGKMLTLRVYRDGYAAKNDVGTMREFTKNGGVPIGDWRGHGGELTEIMSEPGRTADRGWLTWGLRRYVSGTAADATGKFLNLWHQTLLWDRIADLQMGLYTNIRDKMLAEGIPADAAGKMAAHFANRYAGAVPSEAMSNAARKFANIAMFSRSFTVGNLGVMKDMFMGLPSDVQAQIARNGGLETLTKVRSVAQRKAIASFILDVGLFFVANSLLQNAFNAYLGDKEPVLDGYVRRFKALMGKIQENPLVAINPFYLANKLSATSDNEPGKEDRVKVGYLSNGTAIYLRNPFGKIGEEFIGYVTKPITMFNNKQSTILHPLMRIAANDAGFGHKIYNPNAETPDELLRNAGAIAMHIMGAQVPELAGRGIWELAAHEGNADTRRMAALQTFGPLTGLTFSKGYPGGPAEGFLHREKADYEYRFNQAKPAIRKMIQGGDLTGALAQMKKIGVPQKDQSWFIRNTQNPGRISQTQVKNFYQRTTPEDHERLRQYMPGGSQAMPQPMQ